MARICNRNCWELVLDHDAKDMFCFDGILVLLVRKIGGWKQVITLHMLVSYKKRKDSEFKHTTFLLRLIRRKVPKSL